MRVYVAGSFGEIPAVRHIQALVAAAGHEITHDWTTFPVEKLKFTGEALHEFLKSSADADFDGVWRADAVLLLNDPKCCATYSELGFALAWGKTTFVVGRALRENIFFNMDGVYHFATVEDAIRAMNEWEEENPDKIRRLP